jgi:creatinine amidohydrolase
MLREFATMTIKDIEKEIKNTQTVILPFGCTEQHGHHLPLSTDSLLVQSIAKEVAMRTGCFLAPSIPYTYSGGEFPGTVNVSPSIIGLYLREVCRSLANMGMKNILVLAGHGGTENHLAITEEFKVFLRIEKNLKHLTLVFAGIWQVSPLWMKSFESKDYHASTTETSIMLYLYPQLVKDDRPQNPGDAKFLIRDKHTDSEFEIPHISQHPEVQFGVFGPKPTNASPELGKQIFDESVQAIEKLINQISNNVK